MIYSLTDYRDTERPPTITDVAKASSRFNVSYRDLVLAHAHDLDFTEVMYTLAIPGTCNVDNRKVSFVLKIGTCALGRFLARYREHWATFGTIYPVNIVATPHPAVERKFHSYMHKNHKDLCVEEGRYKGFSEIYLPHRKVLTLVADWLKTTKQKRHSWESVQGLMGLMGSVS